MDAENIEAILKQMTEQADGSDGIVKKKLKSKPMRKKLARNVPVLALRDMVFFPGITTGVTIGRDFNVTLAEMAEKSADVILLLCQKNGEIENPEPDDMYRVGALAQIVKTLPGEEQGVVEAIVHVIQPGEVKDLFFLDADEYMSADVKPYIDDFPESDDKEMPMIMATAMQAYKNVISYMGEENSKQMVRQLESIDHPAVLLHFMCMNSPMSTEEKQQLLECKSLKERALALIKALKKSEELMKLRSEINERTQERISQQQKEHFLRQQIASIEDELGGSVEEEETNELLDRADKKDWPEKARQHFDKEIRKLDRFPGNSPEYGIQYTYLENFLDLPWNKYSTDNFDLAQVRKILEEDHYGLEKVKERIVEQVAVLKLRGDMKAPILCLYGPPGVGKTSLGKSIARAIGREYVRVALGGVHDEAEIRGHRRTYVGAMPGRIISALEKSGTSNPVFVLDEIDKIARESKGDPSTALLEVLDPEQNSKFHDNYLNFDYDLSRVMFIATANDLGTISRPLLDRMELIEIPGYVTEEKIFIATRHLLPKVLEEHGLEKDAITLSTEALTYIIDRYTRESGVRLLEKQLARLVRKMAVRKAEGAELPKTLDPKAIRDLLGPELEDPEQYEGNQQPGVVTGLAWTAAGGEILFVEVSLSKGKGKLTLTGQLGDVMKESATLALQYLRAHADMLDLDPEVFKTHDVHIHVPAGAIPKDGPSAGITMATALASAFTDRKVAPNLAMTGEVTLRGKVLPVGGIKEKILAAKRAGIKHIIMSRQNRKDIEEIKASYLEGLEFTYVDTINEVLDLALL